MKKFTILLFIILLLSFTVFLGLLFNLDEKINFNSYEKEEVIEDNLEIEAIKQEREVINLYSEVTLKSNLEIELKSGAQSELINIGKRHEGDNIYIVRINQIPEGESTRKIILRSKNSNQEKEIELKFDRNDAALPPGYNSIDGWEGTKYVLYPESKLAIVDKNNRLFEDYEPQDLVDLNKTFGIYTFNDAQLNVEAGRELKRLWQDLGDETGDFVTIASGYRSWSDQLRIYSSNISNYGEEETNTFSAKPGHSEHQTGLVVDFTNKEVNYALTQDFANTTAGKWLQENAHKYGFVMSYPPGTFEKTGINYEPWHFRYIGIDLAKEYKDSGMDFNTWVMSKQ